MNKLLYGIIWFVGLYLVGCMVAGGIAGGIAGAQMSEHASAAELRRAGEIAGTQAVNEYRTHLLVGAAIASVVGSAAGVLPGTKTC